MKKILIVLILLFLFGAGCRPISNSNIAKKDNKRAVTDSTVQNNLPKETEMNEARGTFLGYLGSEPEPGNENRLDPRYAPVAH